VVSTLPAEKWVVRSNPDRMYVVLWIFTKKITFRCSDLCLDNETPSQSEVDKVSILMALRVAKEGKSPTSLFGNLPRPV
jgi:hypothetical protein